MSQIRIVICDDEETFSGVGTTFIDEFGKGIPYGLIFEPGLKNGAVVTSHAGAQWIDVKVTGKAAHAGLAHKEGVNACVELGEKIYQISKLTDYLKGLTLSPDVISGGLKTNIVCDSATAKVDIRFLENSDLRSVRTEINKIIQKKVVKSAVGGNEATIELKDTAHFSALKPDSTKKLFEMAKEISKKQGVELKGEHVGYSTDGGHLSENGMQVLVGVGPYGDGIHTDHEYMTMQSYPERLKMNRDLVHAILNQQ